MRTATVVMTVGVGGETVFPPPGVMVMRAALGRAVRMRVSMFVIAA